MAVPTDRFFAALPKPGTKQDPTERKKDREATADQGSWYRGG
jgi:hypothetical protein